MSERLQGLLAASWSPWAIVLLSLLLSLPALGGGWSADDFVHRIVLNGAQDFGPRHPLLDLFTFLEPGAWNQALAERGLLPWSSDPDTRISFFRPLSAATHYLDAALWPESAPLQHAHSLLWWGLALFGVRWVTQDTGPPWVAALALLLFAVDDAHAVPIAWLANRNVLICLTLSTLALGLHQRGKLGWALGPMALALCASEAAIGAAAYIAAWELTRGDARPKALLRLAPLVLLIGLWRLLYNQAGYGAQGSALYLDPIRSPLAFAIASLERGPILILGQWLGPPIEIWMLSESWLRWTLAGTGWALCIGLLWALWPLLKESRQARFWALGSLGATLPLCAAFPMDRLLLFPGLGAAALLALWVQKGGRGARLMLGLTLLGALVFPLKVWGTNPLMRAATQAPLPPTERPEQPLVFVNGSVFGSFYQLLAPLSRGEPTPETTALLAPAWTSLAVYRPQEQVLEIHAQGGWFEFPVDQIVVDPSQLSQGPFHGAGFQADVLEWTQDHRPLRVRFTFTDITAPRFLAWQDGAIQDWRLPEVGQTAHLVARSPLGW
jgi:hypothetical protein